MAKLDGHLDIPSVVRCDELLRAKLNVVLLLRGRNLAMQIRVSLMRGVEQEFEELGKNAIELLWKQMEARPEVPQPQYANGRNRKISEAKRA